MLKKRLDQFCLELFHFKNLFFRSSVGNLISDQLQLPLQQHSQLGHQQALQGHPQLLQGQAGGRQQLRTGTPQQKILIQRSGRLQTR